MKKTLFDNNNAKNNNNISPKFCILMTVYAGLLIISNIISNKIIMPYGCVLPAAAILFPIIYILSDLMTELYGIHKSLIAITTNTILNILMSIIFMIAIMIPAAPFYENNEAFTTILGNTPRMVLASLLAYYIGDVINSLSLSYFKAKLQKYIFLNTFFFRSIFSSMLGQIFDTGLFICIAFYGTIPVTVMFTMMLNQYCVKIGYQIICFPIIRMIVNWWKKVDNIDVVDNW